MQADNHISDASIHRLHEQLNVPFCGATFCREAKSSIVSIATGEPVGEPETLLDSYRSNLVGSCE
jgi:hypothetical protein